MNKNKISSWGKYPKFAGQVLDFSNVMQLKKLFELNKAFIPYGNGRSYGDSALSDKVVFCGRYNSIIGFDSETGLLHAQAGAMLSEILDIFVPLGWFLKVTPGTKYITLGGAIASDVHGKNHHVDGCFSSCVSEFSIMLPCGNIVKCYPGDELFSATCGGMGLTGVIIDAKIYLKRINSKFINQVTVRTNNLQDTFEAFEKYSDFTYSVAWIDCMAKDSEIGKCILNVGEFSDDGDLSYRQQRKFNIPIDFPSFVLNKFTVRAFNWLYYNKFKLKVTTEKVGIDSFFYPLDSINNWNRIYGKNGFTQYQFILPKDKSYDGLLAILREISNSGKGSFLAVLKLYGKENENYLSFPLEGYSLALDFKIQNGIFELLKRLDEIVLQYSGRLYLAKDSRVEKAIFEIGYPKIEVFRKFRKNHGMLDKFYSFQSQRLGI